MTTFSQEFRDRLAYGFGHLSGAHAHPDDAGSPASAELAHDVFHDLGLTLNEQDLLAVIAEDVAENYDWTGAGEKLRRQIETGEV